jgi:adenosine deaminase
VAQDEQVTMSPPSAELHLHIEGTIESDLLVELARRNDVPLPSYDPRELTARYDEFTGLQSFLDVYYANLSVLRTEQDFYQLASAYLNRAAAAGVKRAEVFFDPQTHVGHGVPLKAVIGGLSAAFADARANLGISCDLILCFLRDMGPVAAEEILRAALPFREHFIGVGLDSTEIGYPPSLFADVYEMAASEGLHLVAHAGEEAGPDYIWEALDLLKVQRIDHGIRAMEDPALVARLREERIPLTVCPLSNVCLRAVDTLADHVLPRMIAEGLVATINSDNPTYFGGYVDANFAAIADEWQLGRRHLATLARNSFEASFINDAARAGFMAGVDAWESASPPRF